MLKVYWTYPSLGEEEKKVVSEVMEKGWLTQGKITQLFEEEISRYIGCKYTTIVNSGTSGLITALWAHRVKHGDIVAVPSYTYISSAYSITATGAVPKLLDCNKQTFNVEPPKEPLNKVKGVIIVDVAGMPCDLDGWNQYCKENDMFLIEDATESFGARYKNRKVGNDENTVVFSFNLTKLLNTIEGGAICTNDPKIDELCKLIRRQGQVPAGGEYQHKIFGLNFRLNDLQSAIGRVQLRKIEEFLRNRNKVASTYKSLIAEKCPKEMIWWQKQPSYVTLHPYMLFQVICKNQKLRDKILENLSKKEVEYKVCWRPVHMQPVYAKKLRGNYPNSEWLYERSFTLPIGNAMPEDLVEYVAESVIEAIQ
jgi:perosamine synthetase